MTEFAVERKRTGWDIALGILMVIAGLVILGNAMIATAVSVLFIGWMALIAGLIAIVASFFRIGKGGFWPTIVSGALIALLGLIILKAPVGTAVVLTLVAGAMFLATGIVRVIAAFEFREARWILLFSGAVSIILGLLVMFNLFEATAVLLGILLGIEIFVGGLTTIMVGRVRVTSTPIGSSAAPAF